MLSVIRSFIRLGTRQHFFFHTNTQEITERAKGTTSRLSERKSPKTPNAKRQIARKKKEKRTALEVGRTNRVTLMTENQEQHALQADKLPVPDG